MITGVVNARHEATIRLAIHHVNGQEEGIEAILDTGFSGSLTLPPTVISALGLPWRTRGTVILANGSEDQFDIYAGVIGWNGTTRNILIEAADTDPLVGMALLTGYDVHIQVAEGGTVTIEALP